MSTTTVRVDTETHALLTELSGIEGCSLIETVRAAAEALKRERIGRDVAMRIAELQSDPEAWSSYLAEDSSTSVTDGLG